jgi:hypothetical protein
MNKTISDYYLEKSSRKDKKYMVSFINENTGRVNTVHFGQAGASDFLQHKDEERKKRYINRHKANEDWSDLSKPGTWSRFILWREKSLSESIKKMEDKFNINIHLIE